MTIEVADISESIERELVRVANVARREAADKVRAYAEKQSSGEAYRLEKLAQRIESGDA